MQGFIIMLGMVGAGKTLLSHLLAREKGWGLLASGELLRSSTDPTIQKYLDQGKLLPDVIMCAFIDEHIEKLVDAQYVICDGFPRRLTQAQWLESQKDHYRKSVVAAIHLLVDPDRAQKRLQLRARSDDTPHGIAQRNHEYRIQVSPLITYYERQGLVVEIDANEDPETALSNITSSLQKRSIL